MKIKKLLLKILLLKIWCGLTHQKLVKLIDFDGVETIVPAKLLPAGRLVAKRFYPYSVHICLLETDGLVNRLAENGTLTKGWVTRWEYLSD